jgi:hypothetical protein
MANNSNRSDGTEASGRYFEQLKERNPDKLRKLADNINRLGSGKDREQQERDGGENSRDRSSHRGNHDERSTNQ